MQLFTRAWLIATACFTFNLVQAQPLQNELDLKTASEKMAALLYHINQSYVDTVNTDQLVDDAIRAMLADLDPHSVYIPAEEVARANEPLEGNFEGVGIQFNILKDTILVVSPISGGPSEKLGIMAGDKIVAIEGENVAGVGISNQDVIDRLRGEKGTLVQVEIKRNGMKDLLRFNITRDDIPIYSVDAVYMAAPKIGYIKVNRFARTTMEEFHKAMAELKAQGMEDLILDLQGNGGGLLEAAIEMADEFLQSQKLIVYTEGRAYPRRDAYATAAGDFEKGRLVVLINEGSASASEIVSGAVQDWDRGLIIGRRSFGKGLVQRPVRLPDGSYVRLTTQKYYTPSGRSIQKPYDEGLDAYYREKYERFNSGELWTLDSLDFPDSLKYMTNNNRVVYGGGGITPDIFVPFDTSQTSDYHSQLLRTGALNSFALEYTNKHRHSLHKRYDSVESFAANFIVTDELLIELNTYAQAENPDLEFKQDQFDQSKIMIGGRLKGLIARDLWNTSAYYQVFNPYWKAYKTAIEVLERNKYGSYNLAEK